MKLVVLPTVAATVAVDGFADKCEVVGKSGHQIPFSLGRKQRCHNGEVIKKGE